MAEQEEPPIEIVDEQPKIETEVVDDKGKGDDVAKVVSGEDGAAELKKRLDAAEAARVAAENKAREATEEAARARTSQEDGELREITTGIDSAKRNLEVAKQQYRTARGAGDIDSELEATQAIAQATSDLNALEAGKMAREHAKKNPPVPQQIDPGEAWAVSMQTQFPRAAGWLRSNPDVARANQPAIRAASELAIAAGKLPETDGYFAHVEKTLRDNGLMGGQATQQQQTNGNGADKTEESAMSQASRPVPPAAAPVSRSGGGPGQLKPGTIRLTREQAEIAELSFPGLVKEKGAAAAHREYAKAMLDAKAAGKIN